MPAPADVLYMAPGLGTGGTERHLARMVPALMRAGLKVTVWNTGESGAAEESLRHAGVDVRPTAAPLSPRHLGRLAAWSGELSRSRPGLVHSYLYGHHWLDAVACRLSGVPYVGSRRNLAHWRSGPVLARERWRDRSSVAIVANSVAAAEVALLEGADRRLLRVIPNGVPLPDWSAAAWSSDPVWSACRDAARKTLGLPAAGRVVGAVMSLKAVKDPQTLLGAFARQPALQAHDRLVFIGDGPLKAELSRQAISLGVERQVVLAGEKPEPAALLAGFDVFCLPSRAEGCPNAVLEAMAAALPAVVTATGGSAEAVIEGRTGLQVPPGDVDAMAAALARLLAEPERARAMGRRGRQRAAEHYSLASQVQSHLKLYQEVLGGRWGRAA